MRTSTLYIKWKLLSSGMLLCTLNRLTSVSEEAAASVFRCRFLGNGGIYLKWHHISETGNLLSHHRENIKSYGSCLKYVVKDMWNYDLSLEDLHVSFRTTPILVLREVSSALLELWNISGLTSRTLVLESARECVGPQNALNWVLVALSFCPCRRNGITAIGVTEITL